MKVIIPHKIFQKIRAYVKGVDSEISGLGKISFSNDEFLIEEVKIFEQKVTATETTLDRKALGKFYDEIIKEGEDTSQWKLWWHSHAKMSTFFSGTDDATIADFNNETDSDNWILALVTNHKGDIKFRLDIFKPFPMSFDDMEYEIKFEENFDKEIEKEIAEKVSKSNWHDSFHFKENNREDKYMSVKKRKKNLHKKRKTKYKDPIIVPHIHLKNKLDNEESGGVVEKFINWLIFNK